jgi:hypothetical protein
MNQLQIYKRILILSIVAVMVATSAGFILPGFCLAQDLEETENFEENSENIENQENAENGEIAGDNTSEISENSEAEDPDGFVDTIIVASKDFWEFRALPCLTKAGDWFTNLWQSSIKPKVDSAGEWAYSAWTQKIKPFAQDIVDKTKNFLGIGKEIIEEKKTHLDVEIEKEEQEIKQESPYLYMVIERYRRFKEYLWGTNSTSTQETNENGE